MVESTKWVVSRQHYKEIFRIINADNDVLLERIPNILLYVNSYIHCSEDGYDFWDTEPLIYTAIRLDRVKCAKWLFSHGSSPKLHFGSQSLLAQAFIYGHQQIVLDAGAPLEFCWNDWEELSSRINRGNRMVFSYPRALKNILYCGVQIPLGHCDIHHDIYRAYAVILARETSCRRACYTFIHAGILPKDLTRWMLISFVLPSKRESIWSPPNVKMPPEFE